LHIIATESARLAELATRTLLLSSLESQQLIADQQWYSLDEQIKQCAILLSPQWTKKKLQLTADLESVSYFGNAELVTQVWINLLSNAIQFTPEGGTIAVGLTQQSSTIVASVSDSGQGMTAQELTRIFDKYYQADPSRSDRGLGLGLSIVHRIVELCGGTIKVRSTINQGSVFTVYLEAPRV
jgi:signal transduction histidine kinase